MDIKKIQVKLKKELAKDLEKGIALFDSYINYASDLYDEFIVLEGNFHSVNQDFKKELVSQKDRGMILNRLRTSLVELIKRLQYEDIELSPLEQKVVFNIPKEKKTGIYAYAINEIGVKKISHNLERESHSVLFRIGYLGKSNKFRNIDKVIKKVIVREDVWDWHCAVFNNFGNGKYTDMLKEFYRLKNDVPVIDKENTTTQLFSVKRENIKDKLASILINHGVPTTDFVQILFVGYIKNFQYRDDFPKWDQFLDHNYNYYENLDLDAAIIIDMDKIHIVEREVVSLFKSISRVIINQTDGRYLYIGKGLTDITGKDITEYDETPEFGSLFYSSCKE